MTVPPENRVPGDPVPAGAVPPNDASASATWEPPAEQWRDRTRLWQVVTAGFAVLSAVLAFILLRPEAATSYDEASAPDLACEVLQRVHEQEVSASGQDAGMLTLHRLSAVESLARAAVLEDAAAAELQAALDEPILLARQGGPEGPEFSAAVEETLRVCAGSTARE